MLKLYDTRWKRTFIMGFTIVFLDMLVLGLGTLDIVSIQWSVGSIAIITFMGYLLLSNYLSGSEELDHAEFRNAITATIITIHATISGIILFGNNINTNPEILKMVDEINDINRLVIMFYFGTVALQQSLKTIEEKERIKISKSRLDSDEPAL